MNTSWLALVL